MKDLNEKEQKALDLTVHLWDALLQLEALHPDDLTEHSRDLHNIQNRIMSRPFVRKHICKK